MNDLDQYNKIHAIGHLCPVALFISCAEDDTQMTDDTFQIDRN